MYGYVYITTNLINNKIYIGQHKSETFDSEYIGSGKYLKNAVNKYGRNNFSVEVIEWAENKYILNLLEKRWIRFYRKRNYVMYNIADGGEGGDVFSGLSAADKKRRNEKLRKNSYFSTVSGEESKEMHKRAWKTRRLNGNDKFSAEYRQKLSNAHKGYKVSDDTKKKLSDANRGKKLTDEHKKKIRTSNIGKHSMSPENKKKMSERAKLRVGKANSFYGKHHSSYTKKKIGSYNKERFSNKIWINNGVINKRVERDTLENYLSNGFIQGRIKWKNEC